MTDLIIKRLTENGLVEVGRIIELGEELVGSNTLANNLLLDSPGLNADALVAKYNGLYLKIVK